MNNALFAVAAIAGTAAAANAATIVQYQTAASTTFPTVAPDVEDGNIAGDDLATGPGISANSGSTYNWTGWADGGSENTNAADALAEGEFFTWGFDVTNPLAQIDLTSIDYRWDRSGTGPNQLEAFYNINGSGNVSFHTFDFGDSSSGVDFVGLDLTSVPTLTGGDSIVFTLVAFGADSGGASSAGTFDLETVDFGGSDPRSIRIEGDINIIPTPATAGLLGLGGLIAARRRRA